MSFRQITLAVINKPITAAATVLALISCSPTGNPHLDMCMKIAGNLLPGAANFGEPSESEGRFEMQMKLPYTSDGVEGEAVCNFAKESTNHGETKYRTSPSSMTLGGIEISGKDLMRATLASSKDVVKDTANETKKQAAEATAEAKEMAAEAKDKATEMAADAKVKAGELADEAKVKADEMASKIKESEMVDKAMTLADETKDKAKSAIVDGAKKIQESLEN